MEAEIITIGTEILLGEIVDTNTKTLARALRDIGLDVFRTSTVGDNAERIASEIQESMKRASAVITTGGLGPTVDDATREGVAGAFNVKTIFDATLWSQVEARFASFGVKPTENNRRQAYIPEGAIAIENPVGTAPAFIMESDHSCVIALPGVPAEMIYLLEQDVIPYLRRRLKLKGIIKSRILRTAGLGESQIDHRIEDLERLSNPTVGLSAHPGRVDIRITAKANSEAETDELIWGIEATLRQRLGENIYGQDQDTLEGVIAEWLRTRAERIVTVEHGTASALAASLSPYADVYAGGKLLPQGDIDQADEILRTFASASDAKYGLGLLVLPEEPGFRLKSHILLSDELISKDRHYAGRYVYTEARAISIGLERMRRAFLRLGNQHG
jgi:competence/damage-inducible protein CinA-like protein